MDINEMNIRDICNSPNYFNLYPSQKYLIEEMVRIENNRSFYKDGFKINTQRGFILKSYGNGVIRAIVAHIIHSPLFDNFNNFSIYEIATNYNNNLVVKKEYINENVYDTTIIISSRPDDWVQEINRKKQSYIKIMTMKSLLKIISDFRKFPNFMKTISFIVIKAVSSKKIIIIEKIISATLDGRFMRLICESYKNLCKNDLIAKFSWYFVDEYEYKNIISNFYIEQTCNVSDVQKASDFHKILYVMKDNNIEHIILGLIDMEILYNEAWEDSCYLYICSNPECSKIIDMQSEIRPRIKISCGYCNNSNLHSYIISLGNIRNIIGKKIIIVDEYDEIVYKFISFNNFNPIRHVNINKKKTFPKDIDFVIIKETSYCEVHNILNLLHITDTKKMTIYKFFLVKFINDFFMTNS